MEKFVVSALKYRPQSFEDVVGQSAITKTLQKAIKENHLAQALLFTGPRGVGKTTCARILAKMINSQDNENSNEDYSFNIFELDAASNNSVDDIRNLTDQVRIPPQIGSYKVYIIDEVHMLSTNAFNAFLKTLEEPPKHCVFILATTEKHKIIPTILSRCQIFDFKRITVSDTKNYLKLIAKEQGVDADEDALNIIAQKSDGAMRDALSIFDRVVSFCGSKLTRKAVSENLNVLDFDIFFETTDLIIKNNIPGLLLILDKVIEKGFDSQHYISGLASHFRDLFVSKNDETLNLLETSLSIRDRYKIQSKEINTSFLTEAISLTNDCDLKFRSSRNKRLLVELCLMKLASIGFDGEKKKTSKYIIPPSNYQNNSELLQKKEVNQDILSVNPINDSNDVTKQDDESNIEDINNELNKINNITSYNRQSSGLSLKSIQRKKEHKIKQMEVSIDPKDLPNNPFTQEDLSKYWEEYVKKIENEGKHNLAAILKIDNPKVTNDNMISLEFPNSTNKIEVERQKTDLLQFIRLSLQNYSIDLDISVNESIEKKFVYTNEEKFKKMKEKNPSIELLKKTFNLDL